MLLSFAYTKTCLPVPNAVAVASTPVSELKLCTVNGRPEIADVLDALGKLEIRKKFRELENLGFKDIYRLKNKTKQEYTFWDYFSGSWQKNYGMRIDHFLLTNSLIENVLSVNINKKPRSKIKPSDHTPIELEIN